MESEYGEVIGSFAHNLYTPFGVVLFTGSSMFKMAYNFCLRIVKRSF